MWSRCAASSDILSGCLCVRVLVVARRRVNGVDKCVSRRQTSSAALYLRPKKSVFHRY